MPSILQLQRAAGNQAVVSLLESQGQIQDKSDTYQPRDDYLASRYLAIQPKLTGNQPHDAYEREADHIAAQAVQESPQNHNAGPVQLKPGISSPNDPMEVEADEIADQVLELTGMMNPHSETLAERNQSPLIHPASNPPALQRQAKAGDGPALTTEEPSPKALMLFEMFTRNRTKFQKGFSGGQFLTESRDKDAKEETIHVKVGATNWTYVFVTNEKTGAIYVRQSQDGTPIVNIYQLIDSNLSMTEKFDINFRPNTADYVDEKGAITELTRLAKLLKGNPELIITVSGNVMGTPRTTKGNSPEELAQFMTSSTGEETTAGALMLARARRVQETLEKDFEVTNVIVPTTGSVMSTSDGLKIFITVSGVNK